MGGPCQIRIVLLLQASGFSIQIMHGILRTVVAVVVLLAFSLSTTDLTLLLGASLKATPEGTSCPLHKTKCCCPKVCKTPPKVGAACHKPGDSTERLGAAKTAPATACVLKAGCDKESFFGLASVAEGFCARIFGTNRIRSKSLGLRQRKRPIPSPGLLTSIFSSS